MIRDVSGEIRDVDGLPEYEACARMQVDVWGFSEFDVVPAGHLIAMHHYGGTCVGAFDGEHGRVPCCARILAPNDIGQGGSGIRRRGGAACDCRQR